MAKSIYNSCERYFKSIKYSPDFLNKIYTNPYICLTKYIEMIKGYLGEFEELVLTMVGILQEDAYGNAIVNEIKERVGREVSLSAVHVTLYRLEDKGYVKSGMGGATNARGGRRKRIFTITNAGVAMLRAKKEQQVGLWKLVPQLRNSGI
jgi:DNA-binding PadR family transcriptional regulator